MKHATLELGGNAPFIVFESANMDTVITAIMASKFRCSGQTCVCANRVFVHSSLYHDFITRLTDAVSRLRLGDGSQPNVDQGPLINSEALKKVRNITYYTSNRMII
ncbi:unnamed protein product [Protopolystoma xenopodis]|uniref:Succinate-semialdehyde dehydrogenase, mitochondrial n=1 Tax=Protopolystoma xenopodis TaxID=117903 RepID=A0A448X1S5_9PLAT|nr:unnamed protein product [Protopolystoma xenopodis]